MKFKIKAMSKPGHIIEEKEINTIEELLEFAESTDTEIIITGTGLFFSKSGDWVFVTKPEKYDTIEIFDDKRWIRP